MDWKSHLQGKHNLVEELISMGIFKKAQNSINPLNNRPIDDQFLDKIGNSAFALETGLYTLRGRIERGEYNNLLEIVDILDQSVFKLKSKVLEIKTKLESN